MNQRVDDCRCNVIRYLWSDDGATRLRRRYRACRNGKMSGGRRNRDRLCQNAEAAGQLDDGSLDLAMRRERSVTDQRAAGIRDSVVEDPFQTLGRNVNAVDENGLRRRAHLSHIRGGRIQRDVRSQERARSLNEDGASSPCNARATRRWARRMP